MSVRSCSSIETRRGGVQKFRVRNRTDSGEASSRRYFLGGSVEGSVGGEWKRSA